MTYRDSPPAKEMGAFRWMASTVQNKRSTSTAHTHPGGNSADGRNGRNAEGGNGREKESTEDRRKGGKKGRKEERKKESRRAGGQARDAEDSVECLSGLVCFSGAAGRRRARSRLSIESIYLLYILSFPLFFSLGSPDVSGMRGIIFPLACTA